MFDDWRVIICTQVMLSASIITACLPQFKRLLDGLRSGMLGADDLRRRGQTGLYGYRGHSGKNRSKAYYMLERNNTDSNRKASQTLDETPPDQITVVEQFDVSSQRGGDEGSQRSTSRMVKVSDFPSPDERF